MQLLKPNTAQGARMGRTYVDLTLINNGFAGHGKTASIRALVDTGADRLVITPAIAQGLGYDIEEARTINVTFADGRRSKVPVVEPIQIRYLQYMGTFEAAVMDADECLLGVVALQAMGLMVNPNTHSVEYDPRTARM